MPTSCSTRRSSTRTAAGPPEVRADPLLSVAGVAGKLDQACHDLGSVEPEAFVAALASLRRWERDV